jgi:hypothetical protein
MAAKSSRSFWKANPFDKGGKAATMIVGIEVGLAAFTKGFAERVEAYAKEHAKWEDQTGSARSGLTATGSQQLVRYVITLSHSVDYGIWLEVRWGGRFAIIMPTLEEMGPKMMEELKLAELIRLGHGV